MGIFRDLLGRQEDRTPAPPPQKRLTIENLDNELRRRRREAAASGRSSLVTGVNTPQGTGLRLPARGSNG